MNTFPSINFPSKLHVNVIYFVHHRGFPSLFLSYEYVYHSTSSVGVGHHYQDFSFSVSK